jgi:predicted negative regulator of RcsB-dependent stress response
MQSDAAQLALQDRLLAWFETNKQVVIRAAISATIVGMVAGYWFWRQNARETGASEALSRIVGGVAAGNAQAESPEALLKVAADFPKTQAAGRAVLIAAADFFAQGKYPEAKAQFENYLRDYGSAAYNLQALLGVAACLDAQGKTDDAVAAYKNIAEHHPNESGAVQAKFALGRLYEAQNKLEAARDQYLDLTRAGSPTSMNGEAMMRLQDMIAAHPNLAPAPVTAKSSAPVITTPAVVTTNKP